MQRRNNPTNEKKFFVILFKLKSYKSRGRNDKVSKMIIYKYVRVKKFDFERIEKKKVKKEKGKMFSEGQRKFLK